MIHGLAGCHTSPYMQRIARKLNHRGVRTFRMDLRGCGAGALAWPGCLITAADRKMPSRPSERLPSCVLIRQPRSSDFRHPAARRAMGTLFIWLPEWRPAIAQHAASGQLDRRPRHEIFDSLLFRIEAQPGFYGTSFDNLDGDSFNVPFVIGGTYIYSPDLQFVFGVGVNLQGRFPVIPGGGVRWKFSPNWVLDATLPTPRLEYEASRNLKLFVGADLKGGSSGSMTTSATTTATPEQRLVELRRSPHRRRRGMENQLLVFGHDRGRLRPVSAVRFPSHGSPLSQRERRTLRRAHAPRRLLRSLHFVIPNRRRAERDLSSRPVRCLPTTERVICEVPSKSQDRLFAPLRMTSITAPIFRLCTHFSRLRTCQDCRPDLDRPAHGQ